MERYGLIGKGISHSLSPKLHNAAFHENGIREMYKIIDIENNELEDTMKMVKEKMIGVNVTVPYKQKVMQYLNEIDETAQKIKAVNTIHNVDGTLKGYNTDWTGAMKSLEEHTRIKGSSAVVLGAGGAARAIVFGLKENGAKITIINRTPEKAKEIAEEFNCEQGIIDNIGDIKADILVNATSVGTADKSPVSEEILENFKIVFDIVYTSTKLLHDAQNAGCIAIGGMNMLVYQAAESFKIWTGKDANIAFMKHQVLTDLTQGGI